MKKTIFVMIGIVVIYSVSFAGTEPGAAVRKAFSQKFPHATSVSWDKENTHEYEAEFKMNGGKYSANYSDAGDWLETESPVTFSKLPQKVQNAFNASHKSAAIKAIAKIETSKGENKYEVEIKNGLKITELFYAEDGTKIK